MFALLGDLFAPIAIALRPLLIVLIGLYIVFGRDSPDFSTTLLIAGGVVAAAALCFWAGSVLIYWQPRWGLLLMELWVLALVAIAVVASALTARIAVVLSVQDGADDNTKVLLTNLTTAATAFLSTAFIAGGTAGESRVAQRICAQFQRRFMSKASAGDTSRSKPRYFRQYDETKDHEVQQAVYATGDGWGLKARWDRAAVIGDWVATLVPAPAARKAEEKSSRTAAPSAGAAAPALAPAPVEAPAQPERKTDAAK